MDAPDRRTANRHPELTPAIRRIIARYAMHNDLIRGPVLCAPRDIEMRFYPSPGKPEWSGNNGKVCFETASAAKFAADAFNELPGVDRVQHYPCPRSGHYHHVAVTRRHRTVIAIMHLIADAARRAQ